MTLSSFSRNCEMKLEIIIVISSLFCLILMSTAFAANSVKVSVISPTVKQGEEAKAVLKLDSAPNGLAGYIIKASLGNREIATILKVEFPSWAKLYNSSIEGSSVVLKAVDLEDQIKPGATNIELATIVFGNTKQGESSIELLIIRMDDDSGNPINPLVESGKLVIQGIPSTPLGLPFPVLIATVVIIIVIGTGVALYARKSKSRARGLEQSSLRT